MHVSHGFLIALAMKRTIQRPRLREMVKISLGTISCIKDIIHHLLQYTLEHMRYHSAEMNAICSQHAIDSQDAIGNQEAIGNQDTIVYNFQPISILFRFWMLL